MRGIPHPKVSYFGARFALLGHIRKADEGGYCIYMMDRAFDYSPESGGAHFAS